MAHVDDRAQAPTRSLGAALPGRGAGLWSDSVFREPRRAAQDAGTFLVGALPGEGVGPEVVGAALAVLSAVEAAGGRAFEVRTGGPIGLDAEARHGASLSTEVVGFCRDVFAAGGAVLAGPGGGRFVYDMRREFDLYCKISPIKAREAILGAGRIKPEYARRVDMLVVRENSAGVYQGQWATSETPDGRRAEHRFAYTESEVRRIVRVAVDLACAREGRIDAIVKPGGVPSISALWRECALEIATGAGVACRFLDVDYAAYYVVSGARDLDVVVAPNLFGDVIGDVGAVLLGGRALSFSGNFAEAGASVFQTNHGAAYDLAGRNVANPAGQIFSLAMMLREAFGLAREASAVERAVEAVWRGGWRTADVREPGCRDVGTREFADRVAGEVGRILAGDDR